MANTGKIVLKPGGGQSVLDSGKFAVFNSKELCPECCECKPKTIAMFTTNSSNPVWDLTPYQGDGIAPPGSVWRLQETGSNLLYGSGNVNADGKLVGLPASFRSSYTYDGYMRLEIGCPQPNGTIKWS